MSSHGDDPVREKIVVNVIVLDQECLGYNFSDVRNNVVVEKLDKFQQMCGTIRRTSKETRLQSD